MENSLKIDWLLRVEQLGARLAQQAQLADREGAFVAQNYPFLAEAGLLSAAVPADLGGGGASHAELCDLLRAMAHHCSSTALALSMHQHLVATTVWKHLHGQPGETLLRRLASEQLVLVSTGAGDWLRSNGQAKKVEGGYQVTGVKPFASGSPVGDILVTSIAHEAEDGRQSVLHFPVPMNAPGVEVLSDWDAVGMRGTGSNTVKLTDVFVPDAAIALERPREGWHPVWSVVLTVAAPIYSSPYLGIAERAATLGRQLCAQPGAKALASDVQCLVLGEMENALYVARLAWADLVANARNYDFSPDLARANRALQGKTLLIQSARATVDKAMEAVGGASYKRHAGLEQLWRDVRAGEFHPLPEKQQQLISGRLALGLEAVASEGDATAVPAN